MRYTKILDTFAEITLTMEVSRVLVNIGARDGITCNDPCYDLHRFMGFSGLAIDGRCFEERKRKLAKFDVANLSDFVTPETIIEKLKANNIPQDFGFLKIDIDSFDGDLLDSVLKSGYRPAIIDCETNPEFPPPVRFCVRYRPEDMNKKIAQIGGAYGCSVGFVVGRGQKFGYIPIHLTFGEISYVHDTVLLRADIAEKCDIKPIDIAKRYYSLRCGPIHLMKAGVDSKNWRNVYGYKELITRIRSEIESLEYPYKYTLE